MRMDIDEARRHDPVARVDDPRARGPADLADRRDASVLDPDVRAPARRAGAVDDLATGDDELGHFGRGVNAAFACFARSGRARRSIAVNASAFAAVRIVSSARGVRAAAAKSRECHGTRSSLIENSGWIDGLSELMFTMSVETS